MRAALAPGAPCLAARDAAAPLARERAIERCARANAGFGAAYGTAKSGVGIASMGVLRPELVMKSIVPVVMAGVLGIYGLIISVIISTGSAPRARVSPVRAPACRLPRQPRRGQPTERGARARSQARRLPAV